MVGWKLDFPPYVLAHQYLFTPLGLTDDGGFFGVALFFLVSGFLIAHTAQRGTVGQFVVRRLFRILPPLWVAIVVTLIVYHSLAWWQGTPNHISRIDMRGVALSALLVDVILPGNVAVIGIAWTLTVEIFFYLLAAPLVPLFQRRPALAVPVLLALVVAVQTTLLSTSLLRQGAVIVAYLPCLALGSVAYLVVMRRISFRVGIATGFACYFVAVWQNVHYVSSERMHTTAFGLAVVIFLLALAVENRISVPRLLRVVSEGSYSIYLYHATLSWVVFFVLLPVLPFPAIIPIAVIIIACVSYVAWRWVEQPAQKLGRRIATYLARNPRASAPLSPTPQPSVVVAVPSAD